MECHILKFFTYAHLPPHLRVVSKPFCDLAHQAAKDLPDQTPAQKAEKVTALRKLLEAKDAAVRCYVD